MLVQTVVSAKLDRSLKIVEANEHNHAQPTVPN